MVDREQRALLVVPYTPPPPPRAHLWGSLVAGMITAGAILGLFMADYSTSTTVTLILVAVAGLATTLGLVVGGVRARRQFHIEMERAIDVSRVPAAAERSTEAV